MTNQDSLSGFLKLRLTELGFNSIEDFFKFLLGGAVPGRPPPP